MNTPKTAEIYWTLVDPPIEGDDNSKPSLRANFQNLKIRRCRALNSQKPFTCVESGRSGREPQELSG
jgi:hypothetical protein